MDTYGLKASFTCSNFFFNCNNKLNKLRLPISFAYISNVHVRVVCYVQTRYGYTHTILCCLSGFFFCLFFLNHLLKLLLVLFPVTLLHMPFLGFGTAECDKALKTLQVFMLVWKKMKQK